MTKNPCVQACLMFLLVVLLDCQRVMGQGARGLPDPISSAGLGRLLENAGVTDADLSVIDGPMSRYLSAMETLRNGRIEAWLERRRAGSGLFESPDPDLIRSDIEDRRRLLSAIATLDRTLFSELINAGLDTDPVERAADRRARDRAHAVIGRRLSRGIRIEPAEVLAAVISAAETDGGPDADPVRGIDEETWNRVFDHDRGRTGRLERLADLVVERPLRIADAMRGLEPPDLEMAAGDPEDIEAAFQAWFTARANAKDTASEDARDLQADILQADTALHDELTEGLRQGEPFAVALDQAWRKATLPSIFPDRTSPERLFVAAAEAAERGGIDRESMAEIRAIEGSWRTRNTEIEARLIRAIVQEIRAGETGPSGSDMVLGSTSISLAVIGPDGEMIRDSTPEPALESGRILEERSALDREIRDRLEAVAPRELARSDAWRSPREIRFGDGANVVATEAPIVVMGGDLMRGDLGAGLDLDDLGSAVEMLGDLESLVAGGGEPIPRPIPPSAYDLILAELGFADTMRSIGESLYADYRASWEELDEGLVSEWRSVRPTGPMLAKPGEASDAAARAASLRLRIVDAADTLDATLFRDLGALVEDRRGLENAERRRRHEIAVSTIGTGMMAGPDRIANLDLARVLAETSGIDEEIVDSLGREYDAEIMPAQFERAKTAIELDRDLRVAEMTMFATFEQAGEGMVFEATPDSDAMSNLERLYARRASIDESMRSRQLAWRDRMTGSIPPDHVADFLLAFDRAAYPRAFRDPDSPEPMFEKALSLSDLTAAQRTAILEIRAAWLGDWIDACRRLVEIDAGVRGGMPSPGLEIDMAMFAKASGDRKQARFARTELDERAVRSLMSVLAPAQAEAVESARRSKPRIEGLEGLRGIDGLENLEALDSIEGGGIFIGE